ncbi:MAG TPA: Fe-S cluster assembly protein SufD [Rhizomicrobium sp.]|jgi:Fe-S cluster assembly protein SufD
MSAPAERPVPESFAPEAAEPFGPRAQWFTARRMRALQAFRAQGIPHRRVEEWKYSDLRNALEAERNHAQSVPAAADPFATIPGPRIVLRDGQFDAAGTIGADSFEVQDLTRLGDDAPDWIRRNLGQVLANGIGEASLAFMRGGVAVRVPRGAHAQIHLRFLQEMETVHARVLVELEEGASLLLLETHGLTGDVSNIGMEIVLQPDAKLTHLHVAAPAPDAIQVEEIGIRVARNARYEAHFVPGGAKLSRLELAIALEGEGAEAALSGAGALSDSLHADITTHVNHIAAKTASTQLFKYVAGGHARAVYQGKISVQKGADGSDSRQTAKAVLSGARAEADLKPELEILADDVKCAHGAAVGDLDADSLFYMRARGIPEAEARQLLVRGFLEEAVADIARDDLREAVWRFVEDALPRALEIAA